MSVQTCRAICIGCKPEFATLPIRNLPLDALTVRRRIRDGALMCVFVKTLSAVTSYWCGPVGGTLKGATELELIRVAGVNTRRNA